MAEEKKSKGKTVANYLQKKKNTIKNIALGTIATGVVATGAGVMVNDMQNQTQEIPNPDYAGSTTNKTSQEALEELVDMSSFNEEISNLESQVENAYNDRVEYQSQIDGYLKDNGYENIDDFISSVKDTIENVNNSMNETEAENVDSTQKKDFEELKSLFNSVLRKALDNRAWGDDMENHTFGSMYIYTDMLQSNNIGMLELHGIREESGYINSVDAFVPPEIARSILEIMGYSTQDPEIMKEERVFIHINEIAELDSTKLKELGEIFNQISSGIEEDMIAG